MGYRSRRLCNMVRAAVISLLILAVADAQRYFGKRIGKFEKLQHQVKGEVYAVDSRTIHIRGFSYDGTAPDAFFYVGTSGFPSDAGIIVPDENGRKDPLGAYSNKDVTLTLPDGLTIRDLAWISIWCRAFTVDFGSLMVPSNLDYPRPRKIPGLKTLEHGVKSGEIVIVDAQTFLISNFHYDGLAPDAHFWVGKGTPGPSGTIVPNENGNTIPLRKYSGKTIVLTLPDDMTVFDIDYFGVWCRAFFANFGHVILPRSLNVPPSLKMLGVAPQKKLNCEVLMDDIAFEVRWAVAGESIVMQLVGRIDDLQYMSFGLSGAERRSVMVGGDVISAWLDQNTGQGQAVDYYLNAKSQCQGGRGACPDSEIGGSANDVRLLNAALINGFTMLTFQRPLQARDNSDITIYTNASQPVIWAIGPLNSQGHTAYHKARQRGDISIDFGRAPQWNCPLPEDQGTSTKPPSVATPPPAVRTADPWFIPEVPCYEPEDGIFYAQIGPTGGDKGYNAITGHVGWGIAWYINGLLIPEINVVRGKTYTFVVEGGSDPNTPARYHPFYITDDSEGGYQFKTPSQRASVQVFAGVDGDANNPRPSGFGRLCEWKETSNQPSSSFESFGAYQRTLQLDCEEGQPGVIRWTPDENTPDTVYYQCFTHRYLGWKIRVVDQCQSTNQPISQNPRARADDYDYDELYIYDYADSSQDYDNTLIGQQTDLRFSEIFDSERNEKVRYNRQDTRKTQLRGSPQRYLKHPKLPNLREPSSVVDVARFENFHKNIMKESIIKPKNEHFQREREILDYKNSAKRNSIQPKLSNEETPSFLWDLQNAFTTEIKHNQNLAEKSQKPSFVKDLENSNPTSHSYHYQSINNNPIVTTSKNRSKKPSQIPPRLETKRKSKPRDQPSIPFPISPRLETKRKSKPRDQPSIPFPISPRPQTFRKPKPVYHNIYRPNNPIRDNDEPTQFREAPNVRIHEPQVKVFPENLRRKQSEYKQRPIISNSYRKEHRDSPPKHDLNIALQNHSGIKKETRIPSQSRPTNNFKTEPKIPLQSYSKIRPKKQVRKPNEKTTNFAINHGFDPSSVVYERDFRPISSSKDREYSNTHSMVVHPTHQQTRRHYNVPFGFEGFQNRNSELLEERKEEWHDHTLDYPEGWVLAYNPPPYRLVPPT